MLAHQVKPTSQDTPHTDTIDTREAALTAAREGLSVFPILPHRKEPAIQDWPNAATTDEAQINTWFKKWPDANYAVLANEGICFIDTDPRNGANETLARLEAEEPEFASLFKTRTVETGRRDGGRHLYFRPPTGWKLRQGANALGPGVDVLLWHKYVVGPGSIHPDTGQPYRLVNPETDIASLPVWVILRLLEEVEGEGENHARRLQYPTSVLSPTPPRQVVGCVVPDAVSGPGCAGGLWRSSLASPVRQRSTH
jgi:hypothetical protein